MEKSKLLTFSVFALLAINFGILGFLFLSKEGSNPKRMPKEIVIEKLNFDEKQIAEYEKLIKNHRKKILETDDLIRETKNKLYQILKNKNIVATKKDSLISKIAAYQIQIENINFNHFLEIKSICNEEQIQDYQNLTSELTKIFSKKNKPRND